MKINEAGLKLIKKWEGLYLKAYTDCVGVWTIGYGITDADKSITGTKIYRGLRISRATADKWLEESLNKKYCPKVEKYQSKYNFNENQFAALVSFAFNVGSIDGLTANGTRSIAQIKNMIMKYNKAGGRTIKGLTDRRRDELALFNKPVASPDRMISDLEVYNKYIKENYKKFVNNYDPEMTTFEKAKAKKNNVGLTCVVPLRWALAEMGIKNGNGKSLISAPDGSFGKYYTGAVKNYFTRIVTAKHVGMTIIEAIDGGLLKKGDIVCYRGITHTSVYSGKGYKFYEGGGQCGDYSNGVLLDYSKNYYKDKKIAEVLRWKTSGSTETKTTTEPVKVTGNYTGRIPKLPKSRTYYKLGDGYKTMPSHASDVKDVQKALNWSISAGLKVDGQYGEKTKQAVKKYQKIYGLTQDGFWGQKCNKKLGTIKK